MEIAVPAHMKKINKSVILANIIKHGMISRVELANITKLTKATISTQVSHLIEEGLLIETHQEYYNVGRKPIMLSLNYHAGYAIGIDLDYRDITFTVSDLIGKPIHSDKVELGNSNYDEVLQILISQINKYKETYFQSRYGIVGVVIGIHGTVKNDETIGFVPQHKWQNMNLKKDLEQHLDLAVTIENNANLCAFAEKVFSCHTSENLISINMYSGIGLGVLMNGELVKGYLGYTGEIGHMIINPDGKSCNCGNSGCWELYASEGSFFKQLSKKIGQSKLNYRDIKNFINDRDPVVMNEIDEYIKYIVVGLNNIINLLNPETLVLNSELLKLIPDAESKIKMKLTSSISSYKEILLSKLGTHACVMGACALAIKKFLEIPELSLPVA
ncbi:ROK family transcriptional regulator [Neobacillus niacini]|uniref:ROK family transcriptional regulator n=1 Tax=Neobacillus niacini TaxID=86668 RepID=UPI0020421391|nr:ROK family transcriptional regulator [Neobacillus niacini]MCM3689786.1 ROK family transcriptional regulator [Neobacillus niacini]